VFQNIFNHIFSTDSTVLEEAPESPTFEKQALQKKRKGIVAFIVFQNI